MPTCSHCGHPVASQAIECPHCKTVLKAYGHPGIPIHQASGNDSLCVTCVYHQDDTCNFPKRPHAATCTLYQDVAMTRPSSSPSSHSLSPGKPLRRHVMWIALTGLILISLLMAI